MQINAITTLTDWTSHAGAWGEEGVARILSYLKFAGMKKVYWRVFGGGNAMYPSKVASVFNGRTYTALIEMTPPGYLNWMTKIDCASFDSLQSAVEQAHELGLELHAWYTVFEDDHGGHTSSSFVREHPEWIQQDRNGEKQACVLDFFYQGVREYKQKIVDELLTYDIDGLLLDYARHNAVPSGSVSNHIHRLGYNPEIVAAFKQRTGKDAFEIPPDDQDWLKFKSEPHTQFITEVRRKMKVAKPDSELSLMLWPVDNFSWTCIDLPKLSAENTIDMVTGMSIKYTFSPQEAKDQSECFKSQIKSDKVRIAPGIAGYNGLSQTHFDEYVRAVEQLGLNELMLYESNTLVSDSLLYCCGNVNYGFPNYKRRLKAAKVNGKIDWGGLPKYEGFIRIKGGSNFSPRSKTEFQIAYDDTNLYCRFFCYDDNAENILPVKRIEDHYYLYSLKARNYWYNLDTFNLFIDAKLSHQDFCHFVIEPDGKKMQQTRIDNDWEAEWDAAVEVNEKGWGGVITVPLKTLDVKTPGTMGINLIRSQKASKAKDGLGTEVSAWFRQWYHMVRPDEFGMIEFA